MVTADVNGLFCKECQCWYHYDCSKLPTHYIILLTNSKVTFLCETCIISRYQSRFLTELAKIESSIEKHKVLRVSNINADSIQTDDNDASGTIAIQGNVDISRPDDSQHPANGPTQSSPAPNNGDDHPTMKVSNLSHIRSKPKTTSTEKPPVLCKYHLQGRCKFGRYGKKCSFEHPNLCRKFILKGVAGCTLGSECEFAHPKLCERSLKNNTCPRKNCFYYHVTGSKRPNVIKQVTIKGPINVQKGPVSLPKPRPLINTTPSQMPVPVAQQSHAVSRHFLDELQGLKQQINSMLEQQRHMQSLISHQWQTAPELSRLHWPSLPVRPPPPQFAPLHHQ